MAAEQTPKSGVRAPATAVERAFERKVSLGRWALFFEQLWPRAWLVLGLAGLFVGASLAGLWPQLAGITPQDCSGPVWIGLCCSAPDPGARALANAGARHPPGRGDVRHQASTGFLV